MWWSSARDRAPPRGSTRSTSPRSSRRAVRWRERSAASKIAPASATRRPTSPTSTTTAASACSKPGPGWGSRSPISCRRSCGPARTGNGPSSRPTRSICRSSSSARISRSSRARSARATIRRRSRCSRGGGTTSACRASTRPGSRGTRCSRTSDGSLADLTDEPSGEVWDAVAAESDLCTRLKCPHFDRCFLFQARRRAAEADVVVVNHHLLASDLAVRMASDNWQEAAVLPPYRRLILDEAHHLEDVAAMHLGAQVSMLGVQRLLSRLEKNGRGLLPTLRSALFRRDDLLSAASRELTQQSLVDALAAARRAADDVFTRLARRLDGEPGPAPVLRLSDGFLTDVVWDEGLGVALDNLLLAFSRLSEGAAIIADRLSHHVREEPVGE